MSAYGIEGDEAEGTALCRTGHTLAKDNLEVSADIGAVAILENMLGGNKLQLPKMSVMVQTGQVGRFAARRAEVEAGCRTQVEMEN